MVVDVECYNVPFLNAYCNGKMHAVSCRVCKHIHMENAMCGNDAPSEHNGNSPHISRHYNSEGL
jgi:hypothetical protein